MIPARHPETTRYLAKPAGWEPERGSCAHLAIADIQTDIGNIMQSVWEPTPQELVILNAGGHVVLSMVGHQHPPVMIEAQEAA